MSITDYRTSNRNYPLPNPNNNMLDDVQRLIATLIAIDSDMALRATLASPVFSGAPTTPRAATGTATDQIASCGFVQDAITALVANSPDALNTLKELADALGDDPNYAATVSGLIGGLRTDVNYIKNGADPSLDTLAKVFTALGQKLAVSSKATAVLAKAGLDDTTWMTPARTADAILALVRGKLSRNALTANYTAVQSDTGTMFELTSSISLTLSASTILGSGWFAYTRNTGTNISTLLAPPGPGFTGSIANGANQITGVSNAASLAIGNLVSATTLAGPSTTFTADNGSGCILPAALTSIVVGQVAQGTGFTGQTVAAVTTSVTKSVQYFQNAPTIICDSAADAATFAAGAILTSPDGYLAAGTYITGISGQYLTLNKNTLIPYTTGSAVRGNVNQPSQVKLSAPYAGSSGSGLAVSFPSPVQGAAITAISGTTLTVSASHAGAAVSSGSFTSAEPIDGRGSYALLPGEWRLFYCDGTSIRSVVQRKFNMTFTASGTFLALPPGYLGVDILLWGGGGSGHSWYSGSSTYTNAYGGWGAPCVPQFVPAASLVNPVAVVIGSGGAAVSYSANNDTLGKAGNPSSFGNVTAPGGPGGASNTTNTLLSYTPFGASSGALAGVYDASTGNGGAGITAYTTYGGAAGQTYGNNYTATGPAKSVYGGNGGSSTTGLAGVAPGGGGAGANAATSGAGARGECRIEGRLA